MSDTPSSEPGADAVHLAVGKALHTWELLEMELANIFGTLVHTQWIGAARAYGVVAGFHSRREMIEEAAEVHFRYIHTENTALEPELRSILKEARRLSEHRNAIAHGIVSRVVRDGVDIGYWLGPAHYNSRKIELPMEPRFEYDSAQIDAFRIQFAQLKERARELHWALVREMPKPSLRKLHSDA